VRQLQEIGFGEDGTLTYDANFADSSQVTAERGEAEALAAQLQESLEHVRRRCARSSWVPTASASAAASRSPRRVSSPAGNRFLIECASVRR